jgi:hypothetical protein
MLIKIFKTHFLAPWNSERLSHLSGFQDLKTDEDLVETQIEVVLQRGPVVQAVV